MRENLKYSGTFRPVTDTMNRDFGAMKMKKIPTIFERDWEGDRSRVLDVINPAAQWVFDGEGVPTQKIDGTCCLVRDGKLFKRREVTEEDAQNDRTPPGFERADADPETGKVVGWVPVGSGPDDRWYNEALKTAERAHYRLGDGTYELVGPKVQGNPEGMAEHTLVSHSTLVFPRWIPDFPRTFYGIRAFLSAHDFEGIVFQHPDGRMAKIKGKDFGLKRAK